MITLQSGETDKIIVTGITPTPPTPVDPDPDPVPDPVPDPEEIVGEINVFWYDLNGIPLEDKKIFIKRNMLGTSIKIFTYNGYDAPVDSFNVTPTTVQVTQTGYDFISIQIPTEVLEENIELIVTLDYLVN